MTDLDRAKKLWMLLDCIDSLDDMCKFDDVAFRRETRRFLKQRFDVLETDGNELRIPSTKG